MRGETQIITGDALTALKTLEGDSVHCCVTSPPYWGLRDYGVDGQLGLEETPEEHVERIVEVFRNVRRVLRRDGTLWLNYGDCYYSSPSGFAGSNKQPFDGGSPRGAITLGRKKRPKHATLKPKDLVGMPWRVALALQADGWYLRSDIIWAKPNPMPESVKDRPTKGHEFIFLLSKSPRYFYDQDAIREPMTTKPQRRFTRKAPSDRGNRAHRKPSMSYRYDGRLPGNPFGRNKRDVWTVSTQSYKGAHFAVFPPELIRPCILAGTSEKGSCASCGAPWTRDVKRGEPELGNAWSAKGSAEIDREKGSGYLSRDGGASTLKHVVPRETVGWKPSCDCGAAVVPCTVLDPFLGSGTTGVVALEEGRSCIGIELNAEYVEMARKRLAG